MMSRAKAIRRRCTAFLAASLLLTAMACGQPPHPAASPSPSGTEPSPGAGLFGQVRSVGALLTLSESNVVRCAATAARARHLNLIMTAASCLVDTKTGKPIKNLAFIPEYDGVRPTSGIYLVKNLYVPKGFMKNMKSSSYDYAFATVYNGVSIHPSGGRYIDIGPLGKHVPQQGLSWNRRLESVYHAFGYPQTPAGEAHLLPGSTLQWCRGPSSSLMPREEAVAVRCDIARMAVGGPVIADFDQRKGLGRVTGVVSRMIGAEQGQKPKGVTFPYFTADFYYLYTRAAGERTGPADRASLREAIEGN